MRLENDLNQSGTGEREARSFGYAAGMVAAAEDAIFDALNALASSVDDAAAQAELDRFSYADARK